MYARVGTVMNFPKTKKWVVTLELAHTSVILGHIEQLDDGMYKCVTEKEITYGMHNTLIDAAYRLVWTMADNHVHIYFSHASVRWAMEHDKIDNSTYKGIANV
jgi:hypothetical protein